MGADRHNHNLAKIFFEVYIYLAGFRPMGCGVINITPVSPFLILDTNVAYGIPVCLDHSRMVLVSPEIVNLAALKLALVFCVCSWRDAQRTLPGS